MQESLSDLEVGHLIALRTKSDEDAPWIGKVTGIGDESVEIIWMEGGYEQPWNVIKVKDKQRMVEWRDSVPKCTIILYAFELDETQKLQPITVDTLKSLYSQYCS